MWIFYKMTNIIKSINIMIVLKHGNHIENKIEYIQGPKCINGCNFIVLGAITIKFGLMKQEKMFSTTVKNFLLFQVLLLLLELEM